MARYRAGWVAKHVPAHLEGEGRAVPFSRLAPDGDSLFQHTCEGDDDMPAHVRTALTTVNLSVPICKSRLVLGTWQGIYLWEHRLQPHQRRVVVHLIGE